MARVKEPISTGAGVEPDTTQAAKPYQIGKKGHKGDVVIVPGEGVFLSDSHYRELEKHCRDAYNARFMDKTPHQGMIPEGTVLEWAAAITKYRAMASNFDRRKEQVGQYEARCHPGTDAEDPSLNPSPISKRADEWAVDQSRSTICISTSQGTHILNGSAITHQHAVHIQLTTPDGRHYGSFYMSFDQFASALCSPSATPITWSDYWDVNDQNIILQEVVHPPKAILNRMRQRLEGALADIKQSTDSVLADLDAQIASGKPMSKTALSQLRNRLAGVPDRIVAHTQFVVDQATEETAHIAETAAVWIAHAQHLRGIQDIVDKTPLGSLITRPVQPSLPPGQAA